MRFFATCVAALAAASGAIAAEDLKTYIVSFPKGAPANYLSQAKSDITSAGGKITHEFNLINGFSVEAPASALESVSAWATGDFAATIEEDQVITINDPPTKKAFQA